MQSPLDKYLESHATPLPEAFERIIHRSHLRTNYPQMVSGPVQGRLLKMLVSLTGARRILEIGTFTGYSAACMALGLPPGGHIDTLEINDEMEDLIRSGWEEAGGSGLITLHIGDALQTLRSLEGPYDLAFIDADKRQYVDYYRLVLPLVRSGGLILADDTLWDGKVLSGYGPADRQTSGITSFNDLVAADPAVESVILPLRDGISLIRKL